MLHVNKAYGLWLLAWLLVAVRGHLVGQTTVLDDLFPVHPAITLVVIEIADHGHVAPSARPVPVLETRHIGPRSAIHILLGPVDLAAIDQSVVHVQGLKYSLINSEGD